MTDPTPLTVYDRIATALKDTGAFSWDVPDNATIVFNTRPWKGHEQGQLGITLTFGNPDHTVGLTCSAGPELPPDGDWRPAIHQGIVMLNKALDNTRAEIHILQRLLADPIRTGAAYTAIP